MTCVVTGDKLYHGGRAETREGIGVCGGVRHRAWRRIERGESNRGSRSAARRRWRAADDEKVSKMAS